MDLNKNKDCISKTVYLTLFVNILERKRLKREEEADERADLDHVMTVTPPERYGELRRIVEGRSDAATWP